MRRLTLVHRRVYRHGSLRRRMLSAADAGAPAQGVAKALAEFRVHPEVDDRIVATVAHGQPVTGDPDGLDVGKLPDGRVGVADDGDAVQRKPTEGVYHNDGYHHLNHLQHNDHVTRPPELFIRTHRNYLDLDLKVKAVGQCLHLPK